jgi:hypothetical protein
LLIANHYLAPDIKVNIIKNYFDIFLNISLDTLNYRVLFFEDFNVPDSIGIVVYLPLTVASALK